MTYREMAVEALKMAGQELIDRADSLIPYASRIENVDIWVRIPSLTDNALDVPSIEVTTAVAPTTIMLDKFIAMKLGKPEGGNE